LNGSGSGPVAFLVVGVDGLGADFVFPARFHFFKIDDLLTNADIDRPYMCFNEGYVWDGESLYFNLVIFDQSVGDLLESDSKVGRTFHS